MSRITKFTRGPSVASYLHEKQTSRIQSLNESFNKLATDLVDNFRTVFICASTVSTLHRGRCRIEFWPHWISTRGVLIQRAVLRIQRIFHVELRPPKQRFIVLRPLRRIKFRPQLNCDPWSWFHVEVWPQVLIPHWLLTQVMIQR